MIYYKDFHKSLRSDLPLALFLILQENYTPTPDERDDNSFITRQTRFLKQVIG